MDKAECLKLIAQVFKIESCVRALTNPDFEMKSHLFYFRSMFHEVEDLRFVRISSKNEEDNIVFDIYYESKSFEGLFNGCFRIKPESEAAERLFENCSKVCTDLGEYLYHLYLGNNMLKLYLISGSWQSVVSQVTEKPCDEGYDQIKRQMYIELAKFETKELNELFLNRKLNEKFIAHFIQFNSKCSEPVKMFLISLLSSRYAHHVCFVNNRVDIKGTVQIKPGYVQFEAPAPLTVYGWLDYVSQHGSVLLVRLDYDYEGGAVVGKAFG